MWMLFNRTAILPAWIVVFALFTWLGSPMPFATSVLLLMVGIAAPATMLTSMLGDPHRATERRR